MYKLSICIFVSSYACKLSTLCLFMCVNNLRVYLCVNNLSSRLFMNVNNIFSYMFMNLNNLSPAWNKIQHFYAQTNIHYNDHTNTQKHTQTHIHYTCTNTHRHTHSLHTHKHIDTHSLHIHKHTQTAPSPPICDTILHLSQALTSFLHLSLTAVSHSFLAESSPIGQVMTWLSSVRRQDLIISYLP